MTTLHDFGGVLGWSLDTFFWALTISWSQLLARVLGGPKVYECDSTSFITLQGSTLFMVFSVTHTVCKGPKLDA